MALLQRLRSPCHSLVPALARGFASLVPMVIESTPRGERAFDIYSRLLRERIVMVNGPIDDHISMYINSQGGVVTSGLAIYDTMQYIRNPVSTLCVGQAASMASLLLCAGEPGHRRSLPHSRIMMHQPSGGFQGQASDIRIHAEEIRRLSAMLNQIYAKHTGQTADTIEQLLDRDTFKSADEAREFGLLDEVIAQRPAPPPDN